MPTEGFETDSNVSSKEKTTKSANKETTLLNIGKFKAKSMHMHYSLMIPHFGEMLELTLGRIILTPRS